MEQDPHNSNDPSFLVSRGLDEELSAAELEMLERALAASEALRIEQKKMRQVDQLVRQWASQQADLDWDSYSALVQDRVETPEDDAALDEVDDILNQWGRHTVPFDNDAFTQEVLTRVRRDQTRHILRRWPLKLGTALAAAASIVLVVTLGLESQPQTRSVVKISRGSTAVSAHTDGAPIPMRKFVVAFAREPVFSGESPQESEGVSFGSVGSSPIVAGMSEVPPL